MTMITPSYLGETIEYSSLHACRSTLEDPTRLAVQICRGRRHNDVGAGSFILFLVGQPNRPTNRERAARSGTWEVNIS